MVSRPPGAVREGSLKYPLENKQLRIESQVISREMSDSFWQDILPQCPWQEDQEDRTQLWDEMDPLELPEVDIKEIMSKSRFQRHKGSRLVQERTNLGLEGS